MWLASSQVFSKETRREEKYNFGSGGGGGVITKETSTKDVVCVLALYTISKDTR